MSATIKMWLDISEGSVMVGCFECPSYRVVYLDVADAKKAARAHTKTSGHGGFVPSYTLYK